MTGVASPSTRSPSKPLLGHGLRHRADDPEHDLQLNTGERDGQRSDGSDRQDGPGPARADGSQSRWGIRGLCTLEIEGWELLDDVVKTKAMWKMEDDKGGLLTLAQPAGRTAT